MSSNPQDPDYDPKGFRRGSEKGGRGPRPNLEAMIGVEWAKKPGKADNKMAAQGLGLPVEDVPQFDTIAELQVWVFRMHGLRGSKEHFQELGDRAAPKPSRTQGADGSRSTRKSNARASKSEADRWFEGLDGVSGEDDDSDLL